MPEIKHTFAGARMNKDVDERLVPNGEYRDAKNVKIRNTDSVGNDGVGDAGTVQNIKGNKLISSNHYIETTYVDENNDNFSRSKCVGSIANEKNNKSYFLISAPKFDKFFIDIKSIQSRKNLIDSIVEVDIRDSSSDPTSNIVVTDFWGLIDKKTNIITETPVMPFQQLNIDPNVTVTGIRVGMVMSGLNDEGEVLFSSTIQEFSPLQITFYDEINISNWDDCKVLTFVHPNRPLNFDVDNNISSINIIDDLLFFTDNVNEPKKINIKRCLEGTIQNGIVHTTLKLKDPKDNDNLLDYVDDLEESLSPAVNNDLKEEHVTVIRKAPKIAPTLEMKDKDREGETIATGLEFDVVGLANAAGDEFENGYVFTITDSSIAGTNAPNWFENDILIFTEQVNSDTPAVIKATLNSFDKDTGTINLTVISFSLDIIPAVDGLSGSGVWDVDIEQKKPLFELKMVRFGCRYKYEDGECSSFGPWSELAFLPGPYKYNHTKGFNLGMVNNLRSLVIKDFIPYQRSREADIVAVDILYKTTDSPVCYLVKTIKRGIDPEWNLSTTSSPEIQPPSDWLFGKFTITSEMIYRAIEENQLLRSWDNVPRTALAQEISANRLMFSNYVQGYNINSVVGLLTNHNFDSTPSVSSPKKSVKTIRNYRFGMVFGDKYGRETPVIANGFLQGDSVNNPQMLSGDLSLEKSFAAMRNYFELTQDWNSVDPNGVPEDWMEYVKYYVKETSNEYYNIIMDRWYEAQDGNVWISFNSADRNKVDEETYLILKKEQNSDQAVLEKARYKIIAISNEAPNDIKTEGRFMGGVELSGADAESIFSIDSPAFNTSIPDKLMTETVLLIDSGSWEDYLDQYKPKGDLKLRITGTVGNQKLTTPYRKVTYYGLGFNNDGIVRWNKPFGDAANMINRFSSIGITPGGAQPLVYGIEFEEDVITENKAEFDGKFFVKLEKDIVLETKVLKNINSNTTFQNTETFNIGYLDNQETNPGTNWSYEDADGNTVTAPRFGHTFMQATPAASDSSPNNIDGTNIAPLLPVNDLAGFFATDLTSFTQAAPYYAFGGDAGSGEGGQAYPTIPTFQEQDGLVRVNLARQTARFWKWYVNTASSDTRNKLFIDGFRLFRGKLTGANQTGSSNNDGDGSFKSEYYYKPTGIDPGVSSGDGFSPTNDELGRVFLSFPLKQSSNPSNVQNSFSQPGSEESAVGRLAQHMMGTGNLFRFTDDPTNSIYKIVGQPDTLEIGNAKNFAQLQDCSEFSEGAVSSLENPSSLQFQANGTGMLMDLLSVGGYQGPGTFSEPTLENFIIGGANGLSVANGVPECNPMSSQGDSTDSKTLTRFCQREGFRVEFRKVNAETGELLDNGTRGIDTTLFDPRSMVCHDGRESLRISIVDSISTGGDVAPTENAALFETEPKEDIGLDLYYEASNAIPMNLTRTNASYFAPHKSKVTSKDADLVDIDLNTNYVDHHVSHIGFTENSVIIAVKSTTVATGVVDLHSVLDLFGTGQFEFNIGTFMVFEHGNGTKTMARITGFATPLDDSEIDYGETVFTVDSSSTATTTGYYEIQTDVYKNKVELGWFNCYSFGNGVESDRIRDDFNAPQIDNGVKVSSTFLNYGEENKGSTIIYSGIYNSISGVNNLNEFNMAEKITKDLNPTYGSVQALKVRDTDVVAFAEDKILRITTQKDALFNADGNSQLISTNRVLGTAIPYVGDYGISKNPESLVADEYRMYFTDKQRGAVMRLSQNGLTPISSVGMKTYFRDNLVDSESLIGTYDKVNSEYNLTIKMKPFVNRENTTVSFNEGSKGWTSFKSFIPDDGNSVAGRYLTSNLAQIWLHNSNDVDRNTFYGTYYESSLSVVFNEVPGSVKSFKAVNYEGSQARVTQFTSDAGEYTQPDGSAFNITTDGEYFNLEPKDGWYMNKITTNHSLKDSANERGLVEFIDKEGKWYNRIDGGERGDLTNNDLNEFSVQGIGIAYAVVNTTETNIENDSLGPINLQVTSDFIDDPTNTID